MRGRAILIKWVFFIFIGFFKILVVLYGFGQLRGRPETVIIPILGLIYCSLSSGFMLRNLQDMKLLLVSNDLYTQVKTIGDPNYSQDRGRIGGVRDEGSVWAKAGVSQCCSRWDYRHSLSFGVVFGALTAWSCAGRLDTPRQLLLFDSSNGNGAGNRARLKYAAISRRWA
jgi:hypothetical protein